jgi:hypothetical protein
VKLMRLILVLSAVAAVAGFAAAEAMACSCAAGRDGERLAAAGGAFIGTLVAQRTEAGGDEISRPIVNTYRVERAVKGSIGETVEVHSVSGGATCGLDHPIGSRIAIYLRGRPDGGWTGYLCDTTTPEAMVAAAGPAQPRVVRRKRARKRRAVRCAPRKARKARRRS